MELIVVSTAAKTIPQSQMPMASKRVYYMFNG